MLMMLIDLAAEGGQQMFINFDQSHTVKASGQLALKNSQTYFNLNEFLHSLIKVDKTNLAVANGKLGLQKFHL